MNTVKRIVEGIDRTPTKRLIVIGVSVACC